MAIVVDGKWTSKNWFPEVDQQGEAMPMFELAGLRTVKDAERTARNRSASIGNGRTT